ncbi:MAG: phosphoribosylanthranilate isomerase [Phycisphaerae bacterium]|nr:phosphoribosylanthranilate isomerase [Phycisphaerae bacterium]
MSRTRIKICGIRDEDAAVAAIEAGADALGFVFVRSSARYIDPADAWSLVSALPPFVSSVGVFMNASVDHFCEVEETCPTTLAQLHGGEDESTVRQCGPGIVRGLRFHPDTIDADLARWDAIDEVDAILVDGSAGGEGTTLDWNHLARTIEPISKHIILAGGLTPNNVTDAIRVVRPYAVDVSSGVEREKGVKDPELIEAFCDAVRRADLD